MSLALFLAALAQSAPAPAPAPSPAASEKPVCRRETALGSILPGKRVCHTRAEWAAINEANAAAVQQARRANSGTARPN